LQTRRVPDFLGPPIDEACLRFYKTRRAVHAASGNPVLERLHVTLVGRRRKQAALLAPPVGCARGCHALRSLRPSQPTKVDFRFCVDPMRANRRPRSVSLVRPRQRHTAGYQETEGRVFYPFHPRHGLKVLITGRCRHQATEVFVIRQPDDTLAHVPCWMMREAAVQHRLSPAPCLPLACLRDLRLEVDGLLSFLRSDSKPGGESGEVEARSPTAGTVREEKPPIALSFDQRLRLLPLAQAMLAEILTISAGEEASDDQGHV